MPTSPAPSERDARRSTRNVLRGLGLVALIGVLVRLCQPTATDSVRPSVIAAVAKHLDARPELVELEWFEGQPCPEGVEFEAVARVSASQTGDLHAKRYQVRGRAESTEEDEGVQIGDLQVAAVPDVPPEPRP